MRTLFLMAKKFAIDEKASLITLEHIKKALHNVEFVDGEAKTLVYASLKIDNVKNEPIDKNYLDAASKHGSIKFDADVKSFKKELETNGYSMNSVVTKLFIEKKNALKAIKRDVDRLETSLRSKVFGQEQAIEAVCDKIVESSYNVSSKTPKGIFFFLGAPATGKTMLAELMAEELEGYDGFKVFDMTRFSSSNQGFDLFGLSKGYSDAKEGKLTKFVKEHPRSVIVFDEIEKTHPGVLTNFLMMLSSGKVEDGHTEELVDFTQTLLVFTSNLGSELYNNADFVAMMKKNPLEANSTIIEAIGREERLIDGKMTKAISPELLSRLSQGQLVMFNKLDLDALQTIASHKLIEVQEAFEQEFGLDIEHKNLKKVVTLLLLSFAPQIDIRKMKSKLPLALFDLITDYIRQNDVDLSKIVFEIDAASSEMIANETEGLSESEQVRFLHELFRKNETYRYEVETTLDGTVLTFIFGKLQRKKLVRSVDFSGDDGLVFTVPDISFEDVAGHSVAKKRLSEVIKILKAPEQLASFGVRVPKGMLLYGVPGTGKTMLAKAFANEADLPFIETTGSEILDIELMKKIFKKARSYAPAIVFIDEIDAIGSRNGTNLDIRINQFLTELNGFSDSVDEQVFVIAATNLKEKIDPAILRSGRIDMHIEIDALDRAARAFFIDKILSKPTSGDFDKEKILTYTAGMTGADLQKVERESALYVFRHALEVITQEILIEQINTVKYGSRITHKSIDKMIASTAIHEAGHAVLSRVLMPDVKIEQITVVPRNDALGFVSYDKDSDISNLTRQDIKSKMCVAFAGREAQAKMYGEEGVDSGASSDFDMATRYAHYAIATLGMGEKNGYFNVSSFKEENLFQESIEAEMKEWLSEAQAKTKELVEKHWEKITALATLLKEKEIVNEAELLVLMG